MGGLFDFKVSLIQTILNIELRFEFGLELDNISNTCVISQNSFQSSKVHTLYARYLDTELDLTSIMLSHV